jgi:hypothetical protein
MAEKKQEKVVEPLPERIHINEFRGSHPELSVEEIAGLTVFAGKTLMRREQWEEALNNYKNRTI